MPEPFDLLVIGAGPGGYVAAVRAAQLGLKVACIDKNPALGGTCLNIGCIPSKALLESSELVHLARTRFGRHGIHFKEVGFDLAEMMDRKKKVVKTLNDDVAALFKKHRILFYCGTARLHPLSREPRRAREPMVVLDNGQNTQEITAHNVLLATGSEPTPLPSLPFDGNRIVGSTEALSFERVPKQLLVIGGGYIGLELGSVWARLGAKVTVIEALPRILAGSDRELAEKLQKSLAGQGIEFRLETQVLGGASKGDQVVVRARSNEGELEFTGDKVLVAIGRRPMTAGLGLAEAGVETEPRTGRVIVDDKYQTRARGAYAIGDLIAGPMLAHKAQAEGNAVAEILAGKPGQVNYAAIPGVVYTAPELAGVGATEEQLREAGREHKVGRFPFAHNGRALCLDEAEGLVKVLTDAHSDRVLGVHILGARASELIAEAVLAMEFSASAEDIARTCHAHPTLSEAVGDAARAAWMAKAREAGGGK